MVQIKELQDIVNAFRFKKGDYLGAERQLIVFADYYALITPSQANDLRCIFDAKEKLGLFRIATSLFYKEFTNADIKRKEKLCKIFFAMYSFDNLEFGYDSLLSVDFVLSIMKDYDSMIKKTWTIYRDLTNNPLAKKNLENRLLP